MVVDVCLAAYVCVCLLFLPRSNSWILMLLGVIKSRFPFSSHDFSSTAKRRHTNTHLQARPRERCVLVQWRLLSTAATALWTGRIAICCACVSVCVCLRACACSSRLLAQLGLLGTRTSLSVQRVYLRAHRRTHTSLCEARKDKVRTRVCVCARTAGDCQRFLKQQAALELPR